jgi:hypothetical protein
MQNQSGIFGGVEMDGGSGDGQKGLGGKMRLEDAANI